MQSCLPEFAETLNKITFLHLSEFSRNLMMPNASISGLLEQKPVVLHLGSTCVMQLTATMALIGSLLQPEPFLGHQETWCQSFFQ